jgi:hypothetical protein
MGRWLTLRSDAEGSGARDPADGRRYRPTWQDVGALNQLVDPLMSTSGFSLTTKSQPCTRSKHPQLTQGRLDTRWRQLKQTKQAKLS